MARISFDEQVARWLRRSNPGYLGGKSESVGPPLFPQAALETYKIPQPLNSLPHFAIRQTTAQLVSPSSYDYIDWSGASTSGVGMQVDPGDSLFLNPIMPGFYLCSASVQFEKEATPSVGYRFVGFDVFPPSPFGRTEETVQFETVPDDVTEVPTHAVIIELFEGDQLGVAVLHTGAGDLNVNSAQPARFDAVQIA